MVVSSWISWRFPWSMIEGETCLVHVASSGKTISGTILVLQTSCHVYKDAGTVRRTQDNMEVRLDEKVRNEKRDLGIEVGDLFPLILIDYRVGRLYQVSLFWMTRSAQLFCSIFCEFIRGKYSAAGDDSFCFGVLKRLVMGLTPACRSKLWSIWLLIWALWVATSRPR